jgi:hypothetical protein
MRHRIPTDFRDHVRRFRERRNVAWETALRRWVEGEGMGEEGAKYRIDEVNNCVIRSPWKAKGINNDARRTHRIHREDRSEVN